MVVDYKTDAVTTPDDVDRAAVGYRLQVGAYAAALARVTGREVTEGWLVFAGVDGVQERRVDDLPAVIVEVQAALAR